MLRHIAAQGATSVDAGFYFCCDPADVRRVAEANGIKLRKLVRLFNFQDVEALRAMVAEGKTGLEIAEIMGRTPGQVRSKCCSLGLRLRPNRPRHEEADKVRFRIDPSVREKLKAMAAQRGTNVANFLRELVTTVVWHGLIEAIMDDRRTTSSEISGHHSGASNGPAGIKPARGWDGGLR